MWPDSAMTRCGSRPYRGCDSAKFQLPCGSHGNRHEGWPRTSWSACGPPRPDRIRHGGGRIAEQRLEDAPGLLNRVFPRKERMIADERVMDETFVRLGRLAELGREWQVHVHISARAPVDVLGAQDHPESGVGVHAEDEFIGIRMGHLGQEGEERTAGRRSAPPSPWRPAPSRPG